MSLDLSVGARRVKGAGLKGDMPDIVQVERKQSGLGFKTLTTRRFQEFNEDLFKLGGEAIGFLCHYGSMSPLLSRSEQGRAVKQFCKTFVSDLLRLGRQTVEFMRFFACQASSGYTIKNFVGGFVWELSELLIQSVRFILHFITLRFVKSLEGGAIETSAVTTEVRRDVSSKGSLEIEGQGPTTSSISRYPTHFTSSPVSIKTAPDEAPLSHRLSTTGKDDSSQPSQPGFSKVAQTTLSARGSDAEVSHPPLKGRLVPGLASLPKATMNLVLGFLQDVLKLQKYGGRFLISFLPTLQQLKTSALFQVLFVKDISALLMYVFNFVVYYLFYPYPMRVLRAVKSCGVLTVVLGTVQLTLKGFVGLLNLVRSIFGVVLVAREVEEGVDSNERDEQDETASAEEDRDLPDIKLDPQDLKDIEFKPSKPAIKKLQIPRKEALNPEQKVAMRVKIPPVSKPIDIEGAEFEHEMLEIAKSSEVKSRPRQTDQDKGTRERDEDGINARVAPRKRTTQEGSEEESRKKGWWRKKETRDGACQTAAMPEPPPPPPRRPSPPKRREKSFTDAGTDPEPQPQYVTDLDCSGRRNKSRHSSGAAGFYRLVRKHLAPEIKLLC